VHLLLLLWLQVEEPTAAAAAGSVQLVSQVPATSYCM
jgi:hypothetical protein